MLSLYQQSISVYLLAAWLLFRQCQILCSILEYKELHKIVDGHILHGHKNPKYLWNVIIKDDNTSAIFKPYGVWCDWFIYLSCRLYSLFNKKYLLLSMLAVWIFMFVLIGTLFTTITI